jgi:hypothetical protein
MSAGASNDFFSPLIVSVVDMNGLQINIRCNDAHRGEARQGLI